MLNFLIALLLKHSGLELCEANFTKGERVVAMEAAPSLSIPLQIKDFL